MVHSLARSRTKERTRQRSHWPSDAKESGTQSRRELASSSRDASSKQQADNNKRNKRSFFSFSQDIYPPTKPALNRTQPMIRDDDATRDGDASEARSKQEQTEWPAVSYRTTTTIIIIIITIIIIIIITTVTTSLVPSSDPNAK